MKFLKAMGKVYAHGCSGPWQMGNQRVERDPADRKRLVILGLMIVPILLGGIAFADQIGGPCRISWEGRRL